MLKLHFKDSRQAPIWLVEERFTWPQVAAQIKQVYEWILVGGQRPGCVRD